MRITDYAGLIALGTGMLIALNSCGQRDPEMDEGDVQGHLTESGILSLSDEARANIEMSTILVEIRPLTTYLEATGIVTANETREAHIRPLARGLIEKVNVKLGDRVKAGEPLVMYDNIELGELIGDYFAEWARVEEAKAQLEVARTVKERSERLIEAEAIAQKEFEVRIAQFLMAQASVERQRADLAKIEEKLHRYGMTDQEIGELSSKDTNHRHRTSSHNLLRAPFDGIIVKYDVAEGELVGPDRELFTLVDTSTVWVLADVYEKDLAAVQIEQQARLDVEAYPDMSFEGTVTYISDVLDPQTRTAKVRCVVANPDRLLKLQMFATVRIPGPVERQAVMVPDAAVQMIDGKPTVFVEIGANQFEKRLVTLGETNGQWVEILSGLQAGETIVQQGSFYLKSIAKREEIGEED